MTDTLTKKKHSELKNHKYKYQKIIGLIAHSGTSD